MFPSGAFRVGIALVICGLFYNGIAKAASLKEVDPVSCPDCVTGIKDIMFALYDQKWLQWEINLFEAGICPSTGQYWPFCKEFLFSWVGMYGALLNDTNTFPTFCTDFGACETNAMVSASGKPRMIGVGKNESCDVCLEGVHALSKDIQRPEVINRTVDFLLGDPFCIKWGDGVWHCPELVSYFVPRALPLLSKAAPFYANQICTDAQYCEF